MYFILAETQSSPTAHIIVNLVIALFLGRAYFWWIVIGTSVLALSVAPGWAGVATVLALPIGCSAAISAVTGCSGTTSGSARPGRSNGSVRKASSSPSTKRANGVRH